MMIKKRAAVRGERKNLLSAAPACVAKTTKLTKTRIRNNVPADMDISFSKRRSPAKIKLARTPRSGERASGKTSGEIGYR